MNLINEMFQIPASHEEWNVIERGFHSRWNFPGVYGAIDGKHVMIRAPPDCGSDFFNYKGSNSIILLAVVDDDYCFTYINIGANGRCSDGGVLQNSSLSHELENGMLPTGGFFVADAAFPLKHYLLKPYQHTPLTHDQKIFNYRLSRARRIVENAFGILVSRFRIFEKPIATDVSVTDKIIHTACALHNWLRKTSNTYLTRENVDFENVDTGEIIPGSWRQETLALLPSINRIGSNHSSRQARELREMYTKYFTNEGAVSWQSRMIN